MVLVWLEGLWNRFTAILIPQSRTRGFVGERSIETKSSTGENMVKVGLRIGRCTSLALRDAH